MELCKPLPDVSLSDLLMPDPIATNLNRPEALTAPRSGRLVAELGGYASCLVAFSGGVDSAVVAAAARRALGRRAVAATALSPSVPRWQVEIARRVAQEIGIEHHEIATGETDRDDYAANTSQRCFFCKETLYAALQKFAGERGLRTIASGTNRDDLGDHRPGIRAGREACVHTPLADLGIGKAEVREIARQWGVSVAELPAAPCLASRIAYGVAVTPERLGRIEAAEAWLRDRGFDEVRVRLHADELARIEVPRNRLGELLDDPVWPEVCRRLRSLGFSFVTLDLEGLRSGSLNAVVQIEAPRPRTSRDENR